jgi:uroporphyrinogen III methyltransferase/synthase
MTSKISGSFTSVRARSRGAKPSARDGTGAAVAQRRVGDRTADELQALGWMPECVAADHTARGLVTCLSATGLLGARVLFPCSSIAEPTVPEGLRAVGASVDVLPVYTTVTAWSDAPEKLPFLGRELAAALKRGCVATMASPSAVRALADLGGAAGLLDQLRAIPVAVLGPTTGAAAQEVGFRATQADGRTLACLARKAVELGLAAKT